MREIKFRIFYRGKMYYEGDRELDNLALTFDGKLVTAMDTDLVYVDNDLENLKVMQYTGLHDKNGKEIYEGDIVKTNRYTGVPGKFEDVIGSIVYHNTYFMVEYDANWARCELHGYSEVIGNIYEHESLLTLTKDI